MPFAFLVGRAKRSSGVVPAYDPNEARGTSASIGPYAGCASVGSGLVFSATSGTSSESLS